MGEQYLPGPNEINYEAYGPEKGAQDVLGSALEQQIRTAASQDYWSRQQQEIENQIRNQGNTAMARLASAMAARGLGSSGAALQGMAETAGATERAIGQALGQLAVQRAQTDIARMGELGRMTSAFGAQDLQRQLAQYQTELQAGGLAADIQNQRYQQQVQRINEILAAIDMYLKAKAQGALTGQGGRLDWTTFPYVVEG